MPTLSPTPAPVAVMSTRRAPLTSNPNVANSLLRAPSAPASYAKQKRSYATVQREEAYGQPPPVKKQALENGSQRPVRSPAKPPGSRTHVLLQCAPLTATRSAVGVNKDRSSRSTAPSAVRAGHVVDNEKEAWKKHYKAKFPKMVFYFESIPDDVLAKLTKRVTFFGARQEPFFSIDVTHVITTRPIPPERAGSATEGAAAAASAETDQQQKSRAQPSDEQPQKINPSLLDRNMAARRKLLFDFRQPPMHSQQPDETVKRTGNGSIKVRNNDVLDKAREMGKKIWSLEKFQNMLAVLLESESPSSQVSRTMSTRSQYGAPKSTNQPNLLQLLRNERINGPSDRDPTAVNKDLVYFKGPYIYVSDMDEKLRPIMARDYPKVANKADGEWPQFRSVGNGRCPFVEETEVVAEKDARKHRARDKARAAAAAAAASAKREDDPVPILKPPETIILTKPITGKRTLTKMEENGRNVAAMGWVTPAAKTTTLSRGCETWTEQNALISRATSGGCLLAGEPVASGVQPSNMTSAIRSQMISSTSGINVTKAETSKEMHGLQRKVLQKATTPASHEPSSRRLAEVSMEAASSRSTNMGRQTSRTLRAPDDDFHSQRTAAAATVTAAGDQERRWRSQKTLKSKQDMRPGYCENCQDKFRDFDEHVTSRKHRKFAENKDNWNELDLLLVQLKRTPKYLPGTESDCEDTC